MILNYSSLGDALPDHRIQSTLLGMAKRSRSERLNVSNFLVLRMAQVLIAEEKLDPVDVKFMVEGKDVAHDYLGHLYDVPVNHGNPLWLLEQRFSHALEARAFKSLTKVQRETFDSLHQAWFKHEIVDVITVSHQPIDEVMASPWFKDSSPMVDHGNPTKLRIGDMGRRRVLEPSQLAELPEFTCEGWTLMAVSPEPDVLIPVPVLVVNNSRFLSIADLFKQAYDSSGDLLIVRPFDSIRALTDAGAFKPELVDRQFDLVKRNS